MYLFIFCVVFVLSALVQSTLTNRFKKYSRVALESGLTGAEVARKMLADHGIRDVSVTCIEGNLTDHYNPQDRTINLSKSVYEGSSIASAAVAAHETGHAVQHYLNYSPLRLRSSLVPVVNFANNTMQWLILIGLLLYGIFPALLYIGIALFAMTTFFSIITLPVEVDASRRAVSWLEDERVASFSQLPMAKDALKWAAYTYFIAALGSIATLLYYIGLARRD